MAWAGRDVRLGRKLIFDYYDGALREDGCS